MNNMDAEKLFNEEMNLNEVVKAIDRIIVDCLGHIPEANNKENQNEIESR